MSADSRLSLTSAAHSSSAGSSKHTDRHQHRHNGHRHGGSDFSPAARGRNHGSFVSTASHASDGRVASFSPRQRTVSGDSRNADVDEQLATALDRLLGDAKLEPTAFEVQGHVFYLRPKCDGECAVCSRPLRTQIMPSRRLQCARCRMNVHKRCHASIATQCIAGSHDLTRAITEVCPNRGLCAQEYQCAGCGTHVGFQPLFVEPRLCDYTGRYHCPECHRGDKMPIPARIVCSWNFAEHEVSVASKAVLRAMQEVPVLNIARINASLFAHVEDLGELDGLRAVLARMSSLLLTCSRLPTERVLAPLRRHRHFLDADAEGLYSVLDLTALRSGKFVAAVRACVQACEEHITRTCAVCRGKAHNCRICNARDSLFSFQKGTHRCAVCRSVYHQRCFAHDANGQCPLCSRRRQRQQQRQQRQAGE